MTSPNNFWDFVPKRIPYQRNLLHEVAADINNGHSVRFTVLTRPASAVVEREVLSSIKLIREQEAGSRVKAIYDDIKAARLEIRAETFQLMAH